MYDTFSLHRAALKPLLCIKGVYKYLIFPIGFLSFGMKLVIISYRICGGNFPAHPTFPFMASAGNNYHIKLETFLGKNVWQKKQKGLLCIALLGVSNGPIQFESARKIWSLLELLAKITRVLACSYSQNFCNCSHARILVNLCSIARNFVNSAL